MDVEVREVIWLDAFVEKLWRKHHVSVDDVEEVLSSRPQVRRVARGDVAGEDVYVSYGTDSGREISHRFLCSQGRRTSTGYKRS